MSEKFRRLLDETLAESHGIYVAMGRIGADEPDGE